MTREEAKSILINKVKPCMDGTEWGESLDMAIKALEQEPSGDLISRQEALDALDNYKYSNEFCEEHHIDWSINLSMARIAINDLPSVNPQPKTGHWIEHNTGHSTYYDCSLCGCVAPCTETADSYLWKLSNFCPDCGCRMVEPQESEG